MCSRVERCKYLEEIVGYDLCITRRKNWVNPEEPAIFPAITPEEWLVIVEADPELEIYARNGPYFARWNVPREPKGWMDLFRGDLFSKNPDPALVEKMQSVAVLLGAQVVGEEGEIYPPDGGEPFFLNS